MRESIFKKLFLGKNPEVSIFAWIKLLLLEVYLGEQLIEMISSTSSYNHEFEQPRIGTPSSGWKRPIVDFIPSTFFNKILKNQIEELFLIKYKDHYQLIKSFGNEDGTKTEETDSYELNHGHIYLLTELKLAYNTVWVSLNITVDIVVYIATNDIATTLLVGGFIELIRRFKW